MALALAYAQAPKPARRLVISGPDAHGVASAAAYARLLAGDGIVVAAEFPGTTPRMFAEWVGRAQLPRAEEAVVIDIPVNVQAPQRHVEALAALPAERVVVFDHHSSTYAFVPMMLAKSITPVVAPDATTMAVAMGVLGDADARELAVTGGVADRDRSVLSIISRGEAEGRYLELAYGLDLVVREPQRIPGEPSSIKYVGQQGRVAALLAEEPSLLATTVAAAAREAVERVRSVASLATVKEVGDVSILVEYPESTARPPTSGWVHKATEWLLKSHGKDYAVAVVPAADRSGRVYWDVRVYQYWLSDLPEVAGEALRDVAARLAAQGRVVGSGRLVSMRFGSAEEARAVARRVAARIEGVEPSVARLISDKLVAEAIRRDYRKLLEACRH